jgi:hypothetical protein
MIFVCTLLLLLCVISGAVVLAPRSCESRGNTGDRGRLVQRIEIDLSPHTLSIDRTSAPLYSFNSAFQVKLSGLFSLIP